MIPLAHLLADATSPVPEAVRDSMVVAPGAVQAERQAAMSFESRLEQELAKARNEWAETAARLAATAREEEQRDWTAREQERNAIWTLRYVDLADGALKVWKDDLLEALETALCNVLRPFLSDRATELARTRLIELLSEELAQAGESFLELRAPASMHDDLGSMLERNNIRATLTESSEIEFVTRACTTRFESLSSAWIGHIRAEQT